MAKGHIRQRGPGAWELKFDLGTDPVTGKRVTKYKTVHGAKRDAQREMRAMLTAVEDGTHTDPGKLTVAAWLAQWLAETKHSISARTHQRYEEIVNKHLVPALGMIPLGKLAAVHIQQYYSQALASGRRDGNGGLSAQTVIHHDRVLHVALKRARALRLIPGNPVEDVQRPKVNKPEIAALSGADAAQLLHVARETSLYPIVTLALGTGLRRGEILGLRWSDVDIEAKTLTVRQSMEQTRKGLSFKAPKTKRSRRTVALPAALVDILTAHRARQAEARLALGMGRPADGLVFATPDGDPLHPDTLTKAFSRLVKTAGITPLTFHGLRHSHATDLLRAGVHPKVASERLGHASIAITLDTYSHVVAGLQEDAARRIDSGLRRAIAGGSGGNPVANPDGGPTDDTTSD